VRRLDYLRRHLSRKRAEPLKANMRRRSGTLLIAFGGMRGELGMPPFEFFGVTREMRTKLLFVRDLHHEVFPVEAHRSPR
jgi:hypothetical protein